VRDVGGLALAVFARGVVFLAQADAGAGAARGAAWRGLQVQAGGIAEGGDQPRVAAGEAGVTGQHALDRGGVGGGPVLQLLGLVETGRERDEPQIELAVERGVITGIEPLRQAQYVAVTPGAEFGAAGGHAQQRVAAQRAEQRGSGALDVAQHHGAGGEIGACAQGCSGALRSSMRGTTVIFRRSR
jgi:hypothetical protein